VLDDFERTSGPQRFRRHIRGQALPRGARRQLRRRGRALAGSLLGVFVLGKMMEIYGRSIKKGVFSIDFHHFMGM